jgi:outer membrane protein assembly factor BamB
MVSLPSASRRPALLLALLVALPACKSGDRGQAAVDDVWWESLPSEIDINGDAVPDVVGFCTDARPEAPPRVCAADGASFAILWRSAPLVDVGPTYMLVLGAAGDKVVVVDALGVLHVYDVRTGKEYPAKHRIDQRAAHTCRPAEHPGKLWIVAQNLRKGWLFDPASASVTPAPPPRSCLLYDCWVWNGTSGCEVALNVSGWLALAAVQDGDDGLAVLTSLEGANGQRYAGFKPGAAPPRWVHQIPPTEPLRARSGVDRDRVRLAGSRVVAGYDDITDKSHLVALDAKTGEQKWDVITTHRREFVLTPTRIYELDSPRLDVRDAATGKPLGGVGASDYKSSLH